MELDKKDTSVIKKDFFVNAEVNGSNLENDQLPQHTKRKALPRPSASKLDQIFKFNYALSQSPNFQKNKKLGKKELNHPVSTNKFENSSKSFSSKVKPQPHVLNRFGYLKPITRHDSENCLSSKSKACLHVTNCDQFKDNQRRPGIYHRDIGFVEKNSNKKKNFESGTGIACLSNLKTRQKSKQKHSDTTKANVSNRNNSQRTKLCSSNDEFRSHRIQRNKDDHLQIQFQQASTGKNNTKTSVSTYN